MTHWSFDDANIKRRKIDEKTLKQRINEELKKVIPKLQNQLEVIFVDARHNTGNAKKHDHEKTKFMEEMDKLESFVTSVEPYCCNNEEFPGVKELFQAIKSNNEERDDQIKLLQKENEEQREEIEQLKQKVTNQGCCIIS